VEGAEEIGRRKAVAMVPQCLVARLAGRTGKLRGVAPHQPPDVPVPRFEPDLGRLVDGGRPFECLEDLGKKPFQSDRAAISRQPGFVPRAGQRVDAVGLSLGAVVLPQLGPGELLRGPTRVETQRRAVGKRRQHRAAREVDSDAGDLSAVDPPGQQRFAHRLRGSVDPVGGILEREMGRQPFAGPRECLRDLSVTVDGDRGGPFAALAVDDQGADRFRAEIKSQGERLVGLAHGEVLSDEGTRKRTRTRDRAGSRSASPAGQTDLAVERLIAHAPQPAYKCSLNQRTASGTKSDGNRCVPS
jgi:hypothetical protein